MVYELSEKFIDFIESRRRLYFISVFMILGFAVFSFFNPVGLHNPGVYIFGIIVPISISIYLAQENWSLWIGPSIIFLASVGTLVVDSMLRLGKI